MRDAKAALADSGLEQINFEVVWVKPDSDMDLHRRTIDIGAEPGAKNVLGVSSDPNMGATAARLAELCRYAEGWCIRVALEFGIFTKVKNLRVAMAALDAPAKRPDPRFFEDIITDAIDLREQCGEVGLAFSDIYNALPSGIPLRIELRSKALRDGFPDPGERAKAVALATRRWLEEVRGV